MELLPLKYKVICFTLSLYAGIKMLLLASIAASVPSPLTKVLLILTPASSTWKVKLFPSNLMPFAVAVAASLCVTM